MFPSRWVAIQVQLSIKELLIFIEQINASIRHYMHSQAHCADSFVLCRNENICSCFFVSVYHSRNLPIILQTEPCLICHTTNPLHFHRYIGNILVLSYGLDSRTYTYTIFLYWVPRYLGDKHGDGVFWGNSCFSRLPRKTFEWRVRH